MNVRTVIELVKDETTGGWSPAAADDLADLERCGVELDAMMGARTIPSTRLHQTITACFAAGAEVHLRRRED